MKYYSKPQPQSGFPALIYYKIPLEIALEFFSTYNLTSTGLPPNSLAFAF